MPTLRFALNHICAPQLDLPAFCALAKAVGVTDIEIRNDIAGNAIVDGTPPETVRAVAAKHGLTILTINALQRFNDWSSSRQLEAVALADYAVACGAKALILVPTNDGVPLGADALDIALAALGPILAERGLTGLVEPLGFATCSLRSKAVAVAAIARVGGGIFRITHDTFHHHLAGEPQLFAEHTGLVHISGVTDPALAIGDMTDDDRLLIDENDRLGTVEQLRGLIDAGYDGPISFEPFAPSLRTDPDPMAAIGRSIAYVRDGVSRASTPRNSAP